MAGDGGCSAVAFAVLAASRILAYGSITWGVDSALALLLKLTRGLIALAFLAALSTGFLKGLTE